MGIVVDRRNNNPKVRQKDLDEIKKKKKKRA